MKLAHETCKSMTVFVPKFLVSRESATAARRGSNSGQVRECMLGLYLLGLGLAGQGISKGRHLAEPQEEQAACRRCRSISRQLGMGCCSCSASSRSSSSSADVCTCVCICCWFGILPLIWGNLFDKFVYRTSTCAFIG